MPKALVLGLMVEALALEEVLLEEVLFDLVFRWFKFTLKPPYSIACGKLRLAIWDTSF